MSVWPGMATWLGMAALEAMARREFAASSLASGTLAAMLVTSTVPWAAAVPWGRRTGGISWVLLPLLAAAALPEPHCDALLAGTSGACGAVTAAAAALLCPWMLVGRDLTTIDGFAIVAALAVAAAAMVGAFAWIDRADVPLEIAQ